MNIEEALSCHTQLNSDTSRLDLELILCHVLDCQSSYLRIWPDRSLTDGQFDLFQSLLARRIQGEPIAYLLGHQAFWTLDLDVSPETLIPRPDTELLVEEVLALDIKSTANILDLGTGTGAIALALASERPGWEVVAVDCADKVVSLAQRNAQKNQISNVQLLKSNWFEALGEISFDVIVSNPPYIDPEDKHLDLGDVRFEPKRALVADQNGLADIEHIVDNARRYLTSKGWLALEHGYDQGKAVRDIFSRFGYQRCTTKQDLAGNDRVTMAQMGLG